MKRSANLWLFWTPRILWVLFAIFVSLFALDVFDESYGFWGTILALLIHLIPTGIILMALIIAWRWEWAGILFIALAAFDLIQYGRGRYSSFHAMICGLLVFIGILFIASWFVGSRDKRASEATG